MKAVLDARGGVDEDKIELRRERFENETDGLRRDVTFADAVARKGIQGRVAGMLDERLAGTAAALDGVGDVVEGEMFDAEHDIDIVEPEIEVADDDALALFGEMYGKIAGDRRLADAPFSRCHNDFPCHGGPPYSLSALYHRQSERFCRKPSKRKGNR